jgi:hypothetical protein
MTAAGIGVCERCLRRDNKVNGQYERGSLDGSYFFTLTRAFAGPFARY